MSVRAYELEEIKTGGEVFNFWHNTTLVEILDEYCSFLPQLNDDCCGLCEISFEDFGHFVKNWDIEKERLPEGELEDAEEIVAQISEWFVNHKDEDYMRFYCY